MKISKKHIIGTSIYTIFLAVPLLSWHESSNADALSISGIVDVGLRHDAGATDGHHTRIESGQMIASRLTFFGEEILVDGWKASFALETGFSPDTGSAHANPPGSTPNSLTFGRTSTISMGHDQTGFISLGRQYTPLWAATGSPTADPFAAAWLGGVNTLYSTTVRASNSIAYTYGYGSRGLLRAAPAKGWALAAIYSAAEAPADTPSQSGRQIGFNTSYGAESFWMAYGIHQIKGSNATVSATVPISDLPVLQQQTFAASYQLKNTRLHAGINTGKTDADTGVALHRRNWFIGTTTQIGARHVIRALYGKSNDRSASNRDFASFQLAYQYNLSKRSSLYAAYGLVDNNPLSNKAFAASAGNYSYGSTPKSLIAGIRHNF